MEVFVLYGEHGEYEQWSRDILGVFASEELAREAIPKFKRLGAELWTKYQERDQRRDDYLKRFAPAKVYPPGSPFPDGCILYTNEQYAEADAAIGPEIPIICECDEYFVIKCNVDAVEAVSAKPVTS